MSEQIKIHNALNEPISQKAYERAELMNLTPEQRTIYELSFFHSQDMKFAIETAVEETATKKEIEVVLGFFENGVSIPIIAKSLKISEENVKHIISIYK